MVTKVVIRDNKDTPLHYVSDLFKNGTEFTFEKGVNIIVGENGSGKSTLLSLIRIYLMVGYECCERGIYNHNVHRLIKEYKIIDENIKEIYKGVDVYADYYRNTYNMSSSEDKGNKQEIETMSDFAHFYEQVHSSYGEKTVDMISSLFEKAFGNDIKKTFDYEQFKDLLPQYNEYVHNHKIDKDENDEFTLILDEPDRNLSIKNLKDIQDILSFHKERTQLIVVIHNPLLICALSKMDHINWIETTPGYKNKIIREVKKMVK